MRHWRSQARSGESALCCDLDSQGPGNQGDGRAVEKMTGRNGRRVLALVMCVIVPMLWSYEIRRDFQGEMPMPDFSTIYFAARCVIHGADPYKRSSFLPALERDNPGFLDGLLKVEKLSRTPTFVMYPPTTLLAMVPFAVLPWPVAQNLFMVLTACLLVAAGWLAWDLGGERAPPWSGLLAGLVLVNSLLIFLHGNPAGTAIGLCIVSAWCFLKRRYEPVGVLLLALSLAIKPHDSGFIWIYFLLAGGAARKRALQALAAACVLGIFAVVWIAPASPHWMSELRQQISVISSPGHSDDPGPSQPSEGNFGPVIDLRRVVSVFGNDPHFYDPVGYGVGGGLILVWAVTVFRNKSTWTSSLLALAAISVLTLLFSYHRTNDAKLLLMTIPACVLFWKEGGARRWVALALTAAAILVTSDFPVVFLVLATRHLHFSASTLGGKLLFLLLEPAPAVLLVTGCFYLWEFVRSEGLRERRFIEGHPVGKVANPLAG